MASTMITLKAGETLSVMAVPADPLGIWGPGDPRPTNPIAGMGPGGNFPGEGGGGSPPGIWGPGDPRPTLPIAGWDPGTGTWPDHPPPVKPPSGAGDQGNWTWAWSPQQGRWMWVRLPGEGEAGPKEAA